MTMLGHALFDCTIGTCGIAWSEAGIVGVQLPEASVDATRDRLMRRYPGAANSIPSGEAPRAIEGIVALLKREPSDLQSVRLDVRGVPEFHRRVYEIARTIPAGSTLTYGEIATRLGEPGAARAVGQALGSNPFVIIVPCHRVLAAGGRPGGFSGTGGVATKLKLLALEDPRADEVFR